MANDIKLQEGHPVDENIRPIKVGGETTSLEIAKNGKGARVTGNLEVTGDTYASIDNMYSGLGPAYAGMILGYTVIGLDATPASYTVTNAMVPVHDDLKVSFVFPPSGKVEISASIFGLSVGIRPMTFGLSTASNTDGYASLGAEYENMIFGADETDGYQLTAKWYVTGTAGDSEELWFAAGAFTSGRNVLYWGGDSSSVGDAVHPMEYQPFTMKATALPLAVYTG